MTPALAQMILLLIAEIPQFAALVQKWTDNGTSAEDIQAELNALGVDDVALNAAYSRLFPGQQPPQ